MYEYINYTTLAAGTVEYADCTFAGGYPATPVVTHNA